tara:strand:+ start:101 stop:235 length:135 start_codon:yes stop_codon:yes gene_type:complete
MSWCRWPRIKTAKTIIADELLVGVPSGLSLADAQALAGETLAVA